MKKLKERLFIFLSRFTKKKFDLGYNLSSDSKVEFKKEPQLYKTDSLIFFQLRKDLGPFEIKKIKTKNDGQIRYVVYHVASESEVEITQKWFEILFEEITLNEIHFLKNNDI